MVLQYHGGLRFGKVHPATHSTKRPHFPRLGLSQQQQWFAQQCWFQRLLLVRFAQQQQQRSQSQLQFEQLELEQQQSRQRLPRPGGR